ncbi:hypothetical protein DVH24_013859 [Malus domestica]|uniref:Alpha-1,3-glucosyltransferase n=1 Tax=Malus domestica TaxID=3750 RepID=A0A498JHP7_MALDO|nr:hypothetical protein DVH24_013859 [Malus domestica]
MKRKMIWVLVVWSPMLVIVDHLHIQYNGFLLGILLISLSCLEEGRDLMGGLVFAVLLCFKHSFVVAAPVYFVYLLRHYCWKGLVRGFWLLSVLGAVVVAGCFYIGIWPVCVSWADKVLAFVLGRLDSTFRHQLHHSLVTPATTFILVLIALSACLKLGDIDSHG